MENMQWPSLLASAQNTVSKQHLSTSRAHNQYTWDWNYPPSSVKFLLNTKKKSVQQVQTSAHVYKSNNVIAAAGQKLSLTLLCFQ